MAFNLGAFAGGLASGAESMTKLYGQYEDIKAGQAARDAMKQQNNVAKAGAALPTTTSDTTTAGATPAPSTTGAAISTVGKTLAKWSTDNGGAKTDLTTVPKPNYMQAMPADAPVPPIPPEGGAPTTVAAPAATPTPTQGGRQVPQQPAPAPVVMQRTSQGMVPHQAMPLFGSNPSASLAPAATAGQPKQLLPSRQGYPNQGVPTAVQPQQAAPGQAQPPPLSQAPNQMTPSLGVGTMGVGAKLADYMGNAAYGGSN
jgi:hypothetical protein